MVSFRRPSNTEALIFNGTQFLFSWSGQGTPDCYCQGPRVVMAGLTQRNPHLFTAYIATQHYRHYFPESYENNKSDGVSLFQFLQLI